MALENERAQIMKYLGWTLILILVLLDTIEQHKRPKDGSEQWFT